MDEITIATITWARNAGEERQMLSALGLLKGCPVIAADGGSRPKFIAGLHKMGAAIICSRTAGLVPQVKASLRAALDASDAPAILYTEPDKKPFFEKQLKVFLDRARKEKNAALCFAARDARSLKTFPDGQQRAERFVNESTAVFTGVAGDYCYGPILLSREAAALALEAPEHLGWGWRFWLLARACRAKLKFSLVEMTLPCPEEQRKENTRKDQLYRIRQTMQNLEGLFLGAE